MKTKANFKYYFFYYDGVIQYINNAYDNATLIVPTKPIAYFLFEGIRRNILRPTSFFSG